jgi:uncharacterized delta-60 repeat protein
MRKSIKFLLSFVICLINCTEDRNCNGPSPELCTPEPLLYDTLDSCEICDSSFGNNGIVSYPLDSSFRPLKIFQLENNNLCTIFSKYNTEYNGFILQKFNEDGDIDSSSNTIEFTASSKSRYSNLNNVIIYARTIIDSWQLENNEILIFSVTSIYKEEDTDIVSDLVFKGYDYVLIKLRADGKLDTSFHEDGFYFIDGNGTYKPDGLFSNIQFYATGQMLPNDQIWIGGRNLYTPERNIQIKLNADGSLDNSFGNSGILEEIDDRRYTQFAGIQADNKIILASFGYKNESSYSVDQSSTTIRRYNPDGTEDFSFGNLGSIQLNISNSVINGVNATNDDGFIVVGLDVLSETIFINKYSSDGQLDTSFGNNGRLVKEMHDDTYLQTFLTDFPDTLIIVSESKYSGGYYYPAIVKVDLNTGEIDETFGENGIGFIGYKTKSINYVNYAKINEQQMVLLLSETTERCETEFRYSLAKVNIF